MGSKKLTYANGSKSSATKVLRSTNARGFQRWTKITISTKSSNTNPPQAGNYNIVTRGVAASVSRAAVFNTNELLELILHHLSMGDLLTARHVNQHWNLLIVRSPRLKRVLFLRQAPQYRFWVFDTKTEALREYRARDHVRFGPAWTNRQNVAIPSIINPMIFKTNGPGVKGSLATRAKYCETMILKASPDLKNLDSLIYEMFICLPAPKEVEFKIFYHKKKPVGKGKRKYYGDDYIRGRASSPRGVTLGDIIEKFLSAAGKVAVNEAAEDYVICEKPSVFWMLGHVFPTETEWEDVKAQSSN